MRAGEHGDAVADRFDGVLPPAVDQRAADEGDRRERVQRAELAVADTVDLAAALRTTSLVTAPQAGTGLVRLDSAGVAEDRAAIERIAADPDWRTLDREVRVAPAAELSTIRERLVSAPVPTPRRPRGGGRTRRPNS